MQMKPDCHHNKTIILETNAIKDLLPLLLQLSYKKLNRSEKAYKGKKTK